ncbi:hypothetical protein NliqN6_3588 [Naganishia liquefaciens]|uniref:Uncharacterized protein n=1 Tax=Naganishia liquefaciens TaxID=104408 RepID=A0A8H3TUI4_9TREE|nr:hypothetical protein NliqN6_3588 [Naganishia liquefaciens]
MDRIVASAVSPAPTTNPAPTYDNPVVSNERPKLEDYPALFSSIGLPPREDWAYNKRHAAQMISERFFLGSNDVARNQALLREMGITHIVAVRDVHGYAYVRERFPETFIYRSVDIPDNPNTIFIKDVIDTTRWMIQVIAQGGTVFAHCSTGIASSSLLAVAYLMAAYHLDPNAAYSHVQGRRYCATISSAFMSQLKEFEAILKAFVATESSAPPPAQVQSKRGMDEVDMSDGETELCSIRAPPAPEFPGMY